MALIGADIRGNGSILIAADQVTYDFQVFKPCWGAYGTINVVDATAAGALPIQNISANGTRQAVTTLSPGSAQDLFNGFTPTNGFEVINNSQTEALYICEGDNAVVAGPASETLQPGGAYNSPNGYKPTGKISIAAASAGHAVIARWW